MVMIIRDDGTVTPWTHAEQDAAIDALHAPESAASCERRHMIRKESNWATHMPKGAGDEQGG